jgi:uncharacterized cupin superfamily protein
MYQLTVGQPAPQPTELASQAESAQTQTQLSPELKQQIQMEVQRQLQAEKEAAAASSTGAATNPPPAPASDVPDALSGTERVFIVASNLDVTADNGQECNLTPGDVVMRITDDPDANQNVKASVQSSKKADCSTGLTVAIGVQDLQEMHNHFREQLDSGLQALADNGGKGSLPKAPDTATRAGEVPQPAPDSGAAKQLAAQQQQAEQVEAQLVN